MNEKTRKVSTLILALVNLAVGFYAGFAYIAFTSNAIVVTGSQPVSQGTLMRGGGAIGGFSLYIAVSIVALVLHAFLAILNLSVMAHVAPTARRGNTFCVVIFALGFLATVATAALLSWRQM